MDERLLRKYGYHIAIGMGDLSALELLKIMRKEDGMPSATMKDAKIAIDAAYTEQNKYHQMLRKKSKGWDALKEAMPYIPESDEDDEDFEPDENTPMFCDWDEDDDS